jgi:hypothetical protein
MSDELDLAKKILDETPSVCDMLVDALLLATRARRRSLLAEVATEERLERALLTIQRASSQADAQDAPPTDGPRAPLVTDQTPETDSIPQ